MRRRVGEMQRSRQGSGVDACLFHTMERRLRRRHDAFAEPSGDAANRWEGYDACNAFHRVCYG